MSHTYSDCPSLSVETACDLLAKRHRRVVLKCLQENGSTSLAELATAVHAQVDEVVSEQQAKITLMHSDLPKLADYGVIEYDRRSETVRYRDRIPIETLLELSELN